MGELTRVVIDAGSCVTKAGFGGESFPRAEFRTVVGRFRRLGLVDGFPLIYCGHEAIEKRGLSQLTWPVEEGQIVNWDEMEKLWYHIFYKELRVPPEDSQVLHSVNPLISKRDKEKIAEILFENFTIKGLYLMKSPALVLHASGRTSGVVWESGAACTYATPVYEGFPLKQATVKSKVTGRTLTKFLQKLLIDTGYSFTTPLEIDILKNIKSKCCYLSSDFDSDLANHACSGPDRYPYELPDGQKILLDDVRFKTPELFFKPHLFDLGSHNVADDIMLSISRCELEYRDMFYDNIVIGGGSSLFPGLPERMQSELSLKLVNQPYKAKIDAMPGRQFAAWAGGSIVASLSTVNKFWMSRTEYEDGGSQRVHYKFL